MANDYVASLFEKAGQKPPASWIDASLRTGSKKIQRVRFPKKAEWRFHPFGWRIARLWQLAIESLMEKTTLPPAPAEISRTISHALRHEPWLYELELDDQGWVDLASLLAALRREGPEWSFLTEEDIVRAVTSSDKKRHEIVGGKIRALYGHSLPGRLNKRSAIPPELLFHGTSPESARKILKVGLLPMDRQFVHLSLDVETALAVGRRKAAQPVLIGVQARRASEEGVAFYLGNEKVWLADAIPASYLDERSSTAVFPP